MKCNYWLQEEKYILKNQNECLYHTRDTQTVHYHSVSIASQSHWSNNASKLRLAFQVPTHVIDTSHYQQKFEAEWTHWLQAAGYGYTLDESFSLPKLGTSSKLVVKGINREREEKEEISHL